MSESVEKIQMYLEKFTTISNGLKKMPINLKKIHMSPEKCEKILKISNISRKM